MNGWEFANNNPFAVFCLVLIVVKGVTTVVCQVIRHIAISLNGWPPPHLDADGDFKSEGDT